MNPNAAIAATPPSHHRHLLPLLMTVVSLNCPTLAQATWSPATQSTPPLARQSARMMAYDQANDRIVLFGGSPSNGTYLGDTRLFDCASSTWTQVPSGPSPRYGHTMTYDAARNEVILFGGREVNSNGPISNQTWAFRGTTWTQRFPVNAPLPRYLHSAVYDSTRQVTVLFGGGGPPLATSDTWEWDGSNWNQRASTIPSPNPLRSNCPIAYDPVRQRTVIFGGRTTSTFFGGTLEWDGNVWTNVTPSGGNPPNRAAAAMTYDAALDRIVMFGGNVANGRLNDTWYWDGSSWTQVFPGTPPGQRGNSGFVYDSRRERCVLFGGNGPTLHFNDLWAFASATPARLRSFGQGCSSTVPTPTLTPGDHRRPWLGDTYTVAVNGLPATGLVMMVSGFVAPATPFPLASFGMPGCFGLVNPDLVQVLLHSGSVVFTYALPNQPAALGLSLHHQAVVGHPGLNPLGAVTSNGMEAVLGLR